MSGTLEVTTFRDWSAALASRVKVKVVISRLMLISVFPLGFHGRLLVVRTMFIPGALHGIEASSLTISSLNHRAPLFSGFFWTCRQLLANVGAVLCLLGGPQECHPVFCVVRHRFRMVWKYLTVRLR